MAAFWLNFLGFRPESIYLVGKRSGHWLKIKSQHEAVCHIVCLKTGTGNFRESITALIPAEMKDGKLHYCGDVAAGLPGSDFERENAGSGARVFTVLKRMG